MARRPARSSRSMTIGNRGRRAPITAIAAMRNHCRHRGRQRTRKRTACRARSRSAQRSRIGPGVRQRMLGERGSGRRRPRPPRPDRACRRRQRRHRRLTTTPTATNTMRPRSVRASISRSRSPRSNAIRRATGPRHRPGPLAASADRAPLAHGDRLIHADSPGHLARLTSWRVERTRAAAWRVAPPIASRPGPKTRLRCLTLNWPTSSARRGSAIDRSTATSLRSDLATALV